MISGGKGQLRSTPKEPQKSKTRSHDKPTILPQYTGNITQNFARKLQKLCEVVFITRKIRSSLPTLKSSFDRDLNSHLVYEIKCGCGYNNFGQTRRHVTTRISEHQKRIHKWVNILLNVVVPRMTLNGNVWTLVGQ